MQCRLWGCLIWVAVYHRQEASWGFDTVNIVDVWLVSNNISTLVLFWRAVLVVVAVCNSNELVSKKVDLMSMQKQYEELHNGNDGYRLE